MRGDQLDIAVGRRLIGIWRVKTIDIQEQAAGGGPVALVDEVKDCLNRLLQLGDRANAFDENTRLLGELPELDSMAVLTIITGLEEHFGFVVDDDEISAECFETVGSLTDLVRSKIS